jgi:hypothetical protein
MRHVYLLLACVLSLGAGVPHSAFAGGVIEDTVARGEVQRGKLYLVGADGIRRPAPDGEYRTRAGERIIVQNGLIRGGRADGILIGLLLPAVHPNGTAMNQGPTNPGTLRGFNPQPDIPGRGADAETHGFSWGAKGQQPQAPSAK